MLWGLLRHGLRQYSGVFHRLSLLHAAGMPKSQYTPCIARRAFGFHHVDKQISFTPPTLIRLSRAATTGRAPRKPARTLPSPRGSIPEDYAVAEHCPYPLLTKEESFLLSNEPWSAL